MSDCVAKGINFYIVPETQMLVDWTSALARFFTWLWICTIEKYKLGNTTFLKLVKSSVYQSKNNLMFNAFICACAWIYVYYYDSSAYSVCARKYSGNLKICCN